MIPARVLAAAVTLAVGGTALLSAVFGLIETHRCGPGFVVIAGMELVHQLWFWPAFLAAAAVGAVVGLRLRRVLPEWWWVTTTLVVCGAIVLGTIGNATAPLYAEELPAGCVLP